jgi:hypothetical protein
MDLKETGYDIIDYITLDQDRIQALVSTVMKLCFP